MSLMSMWTKTILRSLDIILAFAGLMLLAPILLMIYLLAVFDTGNPLLRQIRLGRHQRPFVLLKFRTMKLDTAQLPSHLVNRDAITPFGSILRRTKLDELPQLWNVLQGEMSLVGPRPGLPNQYELTKNRAAQDVFSVRPGITGLAQLSGVDMSTPDLLARTDAKMLRKFTIICYLKYIFMTLVGKGVGDSVKSR